MALGINLILKHLFQNVLASIDAELTFFEDLAARELFSAPFDRAGLVGETCHLEGPFDESNLTAARNTILLNLDREGVIVFPWW